MDLIQATTGYSLLSEEIRKEIRKVERSVVSVNAAIDYQVQRFHYQVEEGRFVPDPESPLGYALLAEGGVSYDRDEKTNTGAGILLVRDPSTGAHVILTSNHVVSPRDTTDIYYLDEDGRPTDVIFRRYVVKSVEVSVRGAPGWPIPAQLVAGNPADDLAIIVAESDFGLADPYEQPGGADLDLSWGDWVFLFGYPREVKRMTGGWVSESPYRGTFAVDAVVQFGFSGGPAFAIAKDGTRFILAGLIKSVPSGTVDYIAPDGTLPIGYRLSGDDVGHLIVVREHRVDYGAVYCVDADKIQQFLRAARKPLEQRGIGFDPGLTESDSRASRSE